mgnify:CR=1 FL=1
MRLADETVVAASEADIFLFPPQKGNSVSKCGVPKSEFLASDGKSEGQEDFALYFCFDKDESTAMVVPLRAFQTQSRRKYSVKDLVNSAFHCFVLYQSTKVPPAERTDEKIEHGANSSDNIKNTP